MRRMLTIGAEGWLMDLRREKDRQFELQARQIRYRPSTGRSTHLLDIDLELVIPKILESVFLGAFEKSQLQTHVERTLTIYKELDRDLANSLERKHGRLVFTHEFRDVIGVSCYSKFCRGLWIAFCDVPMGKRVVEKLALDWFEMKLHVFHGLSPLVENVIQALEDEDTEKADQALQDNLTEILKRSRYARGRIISDGSPLTFWQRVTRRMYNAIGWG